MLDVDESLLLSPEISQKLEVGKVGAADINEARAHSSAKCVRRG
jgi:hypothetical protein